MALGNLGALHQSQGRLEEALEYFDKAIEEDPQFLAAHNNRGRVLNNLRRYEDAAEAFRTAVKIRPDFAEAHNNLGHVYRAMGEMERAGDCFMDAIRIDPEYALAYHNLGTVRMELSKPEEALQAFRKSVELNPNDVLALTNLGVILHNLGRPDLRLSHAQNLAVGRALESSGRTIDEIEHIDAYSCFPIAVLSACVAMGIDPATDRTLTLTGGLPFFGGAGNNYSMHAIAECRDLGLGVFGDECWQAQAEVLEMVPVAYKHARQSHQSR